MKKLWEYPMLSAEAFEQARAGILKWDNAKREYYRACASDYMREYPGQQQKTPTFNDLVMQCRGHYTDDEVRDYLVWHFGSDLDVKPDILKPGWFRAKT